MVLSTGLLSILTERPQLPLEQGVKEVGLLCLGLASEGIYYYCHPWTLWVMLATQVPGRHKYMDTSRHRSSQVLWGASLLCKLQVDTQVILWWFFLVSVTVMMFVKWWLYNLVFQHSFFGILYQCSFIHSLTSTWTCGFLFFNGVYSIILFRLQLGQIWPIRPSWSWGLCPLTNYLHSDFLTFSSRLISSFSTQFPAFFPRNLLPSPLSKELWFFLWRFAFRSWKLDAVWPIATEPPEF